MGKRLPQDVKRWKRNWQEKWTKASIYNTLNAKKPYDHVIHRRNTFLAKRTTWQEISNIFCRWSVSVQVSRSVDKGCWRSTLQIAETEPKFLARDLIVFISNVVVTSFPRFVRTPIISSPVIWLGNTLFIQAGFGYAPGKHSYHWVTCP